MAERILVALGGNALVRVGQRGTIQEQMANLDLAMAGIVPLIQRGCHVVITHGNGPQVGHILLRVEAARHQAYDLPLDVCVAQSQGETGYLIQQTLENLLRKHQIDRTVCAVLCRTVVDQHDPKLTNPSKPVGPYYSREDALALKTQAWSLAEEPPHGFRRVVPSPEPIRIVETEAIQRLVGDGVIVIAVGGGGIPVSAETDGTLQGIEAVVDKDLASSQLAVMIGVERILDLTSVEFAKLHFNSPSEENLQTITVADAKKYLAEGHFAPGSMQPKIEAGIYFLEHGGREFIITHTEKALDGFEGRTGTHMVPN
ncbi:MAG: carbamate kinase [Nitrospirota bacterium]